MISPTLMRAFHNATTGPHVTLAKKVSGLRGLLQAIVETFDAGEGNNISRALGGGIGRELRPDDLEGIGHSTLRIPRRRSTLYPTVPA
jgi:hypothetical protein